MSDVIERAAPVAAPEHGTHRRASRLVALLVAVLALVLAFVWRSTAIRAGMAEENHRALATAAWSSIDLWAVLDIPPAQRDLAAVTGGANLGVPDGAGPYVRTDVVVNQPDSISVLLTVRSDGMTTYSTSMARRSAGTSETDAGGCTEGELVDGVPCVEWIQRLARQWQG
jgi:hypothetical protein